MSGEAGAAKNASPSREATFGSFSNREGLVRSITVLRGHSNERVQKLRSEVGTVWPCHGVQIRMHLKRTKRLHIPKGLKNWTSQLASQVDLSFYAVGETEPQNEVSYIPCFGKSYHGRYSRGSIGSRGSLLRAHSQLDSSSLLCNSYHSKTWRRARFGNFPVTTPSAISTVTSYSPYFA